MFGVEIYLYLYLYLSLYTSEKFSNLKMFVIVILYHFCDTLKKLRYCVVGSVSDIQFNEPMFWFTILINLVSAKAPVPVGR